MNILIPDSWLREYLTTDAKPKDVQMCLSLCGPSVEKIDIVRDDCVYNIEITSNRVDTASVFGIAREAAAILPRFGFSAKLNDLKINQNPNCQESIPLEITDKNHLCRRIIGVVIDRVKIGHSPRLIKDRLEKSGVRPLNNIIDITNYVMLELGHPVHVFDYDRIGTNKLIIRNARKGESLVTLDEKKHDLDGNDVVIDDGTGRIIDLPGIMGTKNSVITSESTRILLFTEANDPYTIRQTSMRLGIRTLAASINEKNPDPELTEKAFYRCMDLYKEITGGSYSSKIVDIYPFYQPIPSIRISVEAVNNKLGIALTKKEIVLMLKSLEFKVKEEGKSELIVSPPSYRRFDIQIPEDIIEEVARLYGYHNFPSRIMAGQLPESETDEDYATEFKIKTCLKYWGFTEIYSYSFSSKTVLEKAGLNTADHLKIANPLTTETEYMRTSLIPAMLNIIAENLPFTENPQFFEMSKVYCKRENDLPAENNKLLITTGKGILEMKGFVEQLFHDLGLTGYNAVPLPAGFLSSHQSYALKYADKQIGILGRLSPTFQDRYGISIPVYLAELDLETILSLARPVKKYSGIPNFPPVIENLTLEMNDQVNYADVTDTIRQNSQLIRSVSLISKYQNRITLNLEFMHPEKNLTKEDIAGEMRKIISALEKNIQVIHAKLPEQKSPPEVSDGK